MTTTPPIDLSIVIPVYNEEANLHQLCDRLLATLPTLPTAIEIVFTNDGSTDRSLSILNGYVTSYPHLFRVIDFHGNFGQHMAIIAGFEHSRGDIIVTLDADLQNPPEEICKLLDKLNEGYDYVGSYREKRQDSFFRTYVSRLVNWARDAITDISMKDHGCMLRAYSRRIVDLIVASQERSTYIPALAYKFSLKPTEVQVKHEERAGGTSKYNLYKLIRLNFDLVTGFSLVPLQAFTLIGLAVSFFSGMLVIYMLARRLFLGPEVEGVFTLFAILFFLISVAITGIGLVGEYLGRIFQTISQRPRYVIREILEAQRAKPSETRSKKK